MKHRLYISLFANLLPHIKHTCEPISSAVKSNESGHIALLLSMVSLLGIEKFKMHFGGCHTSLVDAHRDAYLEWQKMNHI